MAAPAVKTQGIKVYIGTTATDGSTDTYTQIKRCHVLGELGAEAQVIDATALEDSFKEKLKGIPDAGDLEVGGRRVFTDAGQNALEAAAISPEDEGYNMRIEIPGAAASGLTVRYAFKALISKFKTKPGQVDGLIEYSAMAAITGAITQTAI